jgi:hypothetical protein
MCLILILLVILIIFYIYKKNSIDNFQNNNMVKDRRRFADPSLYNYATNVAKDLDQPFNSPPASPYSNYSLEDLDGTDVGVINT